MKERTEMKGTHGSEIVLRGEEQGEKRLGLMRETKRRRERGREIVEARIIGDRV